MAAPMVAYSVATSVAPLVVPTLIAVVVFITLAGISIGIGTSAKLPGWATALMVFMPAGIAGYGFHRYRERNLYNSRQASYQYSYPQSQMQQPAPMAPQMNMAQSSSPGYLSVPQMPNNFIPR